MNNISKEEADKFVIHSRQLLDLSNELLNLSKKGLLNSNDKAKQTKILEEIKTITNWFIQTSK
jgi:hypothetical protein